MVGIEDDCDAGEAERDSRALDDAVDRE